MDVASLKKEAESTVSYVEVSSVMSEVENLQTFAGEPPPDSGADLDRRAGDWAEPWT